MQINQENTVLAGVLACKLKGHLFAGQAPCWERGRRNQSMYLSHIDVSLPLFLPPFPSL